MKSHTVKLQFYSNFKRIARDRKGLDSGVLCLIYHLPSSV